MAASADPEAAEDVLLQRIMDTVTHVESAVVSRRSAESYGRMYAMHRYWSRKSPDVVAAYIEAYTKPGDIVLDPFCGGGVVACEACRLGRRVIAIDINPMAAFITRMLLEPASLYRLNSAFETVRAASSDCIQRLYATTCTRCRAPATIDFVIWEGDKPRQLAYTCGCSEERIVRPITPRDRRQIESLSHEPVPYWFPDKYELPKIQKERYRFVHELFTKRNLIALSILHHAIDAVQDQRSRDLLKLAFTSSLDKCSKLKPTPPSSLTGESKPTLSMSWAAPRFYAPRVAQEVNPWQVFHAAFKRVLDGKEESNRCIPTVALGKDINEFLSGRCDAVILTGAAKDLLANQVAPSSIDYVLTDPPYGYHIQYGALSTLWGAWLQLHFDYGNEIVASTRSQRARSTYFTRLEATLAAVQTVVKTGSYSHFFYHDVRGQYFRPFLSVLTRVGFSPERIIYQPPVHSFGYAARRKAGDDHHAGDYIVRVRKCALPIPATSETTLVSLQHRLADLAKRTLEVYGGSVPAGTMLHSIYQSLSGPDVQAFAAHSPLQVIRDSLEGYAELIDNVFVAGDHVTEESPYKSKIRQALLDARAMLAEESDHTTLAQRIVLRRLEADRVTWDYVRTEYAKIKRGDVTEHRCKRYAHLLTLCGQALGYTAPPSESSRATVQWWKDGRLCAEFAGLDGPRILLRVPHRDNGNSHSVEWGALGFTDLERVFWRISQSNTEAHDALVDRLNPMEIESPSRPRAEVSPRHIKPFRLKIRANRSVCSGYYVMELMVPPKVEIDVRAGQFFHILCDPIRTLKERGSTKEDAPLTLRRPLSVHRLHYAGFDRRLLNRSSDIPRELREAVRRRIEQIDFLYKVVGKGTERLAEHPKGVYADVLGPLGKGFTIGDEEIAVVVGGGVGIAPLVALAERLRYADKKVHVYLGALKEEHLRMAVRPDSVVQRGFADGTPGFAQMVNDEFFEIGASSVTICTDDGSVGIAGRVPDVLAGDLARWKLQTGQVRIYACGPLPMMKAVSDIAARLGARCEVLLEERMACGVGACWSCVCMTRNQDGGKQLSRVCTDGPVFEASQVCWQI